MNQFVDALELKEKIRLFGWINCNEDNFPCSSLFGHFLQRVVVPLGAGLVEFPQHEGDRERSVR